MSLQSEWETAKKLAISALDKAIKAAELEEKGVPKKPGPKTAATKSVRAGFSTACRAVDTCCIAVDEALEEGDKAKARRDLEAFKHTWGSHLESLKRRNQPESPYVRDELSNLNKWFTNKHAAWKKQLAG